MFRKVWSAYGNSLAKRPLLTKMATTGVIYGAGDLTSQFLTPYLNNQKEWRFDTRRFLGQTAFGFLLLGPFFHQYFRVLDLVVKSTGWTGAFYKLLLDQTFGATIIITGFTSWSVLFKGGSFNDVVTTLGSSFIDFYKLNLMVWPAAGVINFGLIPTHYRTLFANIVSFFWSGLLSYVFAQK